MAKKPVFDFKTWYENLPADNPEEELKGIAIPDPFGFDVGSESDLSERRIFVTDFLPGDVEDFLKNLLEKYKPTQNNKKSLSVIFTRYFENWQNEHRKSCFYEPFLWALKCRDNYIGSLRNNADPQPWLVEFLGDLLYKQWKDTPDFMKVLENVITNWEWYQPVHIMLYVYRKLANVNEESLDKHIRENLLYRSLFSTSAFFCLCEKKKSRENIKALMFFVSKEEQDSTGFTKIQITKKMREGVEKYIKNLSDSEFDVAQTYYTDEMRSCSRKARKFYDDIFFPNPSIESEISDLANEWRANENKEYSALYKSRLAALLDKDNKQVIRVTANSRCESMIDSLLTIIDERQFDFYTQLILREMAGYAGCEKYTAYIKNKYLSLI